MISILKEPTYAGAYAYGRTTVQKRIVDGRIEKSIVRKRLDEWTELLPNRHAGYITWEQFTRIQDMIDENSTGFERRGTAKKGPALLAGLLRCRRCGRKLMVAYSGKNAAIPRYQCHRGRLDNLEPKCISFGGLSIDDAVSKEILRVVQPGAVEAAALAVSEESQQRDELIEVLRIELKAARYEAQRAQRQYDGVDPDNRLVADELERRWNVALQKVHDLKIKIERQQTRSPPVPADPVTFQSLAEDLSRVWNAPATDQRLKKRIIRTLIEELAVDLDVDRSEVELVIPLEGRYAQRASSPPTPTRAKRGTDQR